jgi:hypothetical protein
MRCGNPPGLVAPRLALAQDDLATSLRAQKKLQTWFIQVPILPRNWLHELDPVQRLGTRLHGSRKAMCWGSASNEQIHEECTA